MPGGLTRVADGTDPHAPWLELGDVSKDTWVLSDQPVEQFSLLAQRQASQRLHRGGRDLPSRTADNLFWLGRYTERAEGAVRLLRSLVIRLGGEMGSTRTLVSPERVVAMLMAQKHLSTRRGRRAMQEGREAVQEELWTILFDPECKDGLATVLGNVQRNAEAVRERLSFDTFRILRDLTEVSQSWELSPGHETDDALRLLNRLIQYLAAFNGMVAENMTHGYGWRFLDMGRRLERTRAMIQMIQQLAVRGDAQAGGELELLLELADSTMTYRARYQAAPQLAAVLDLLLCDETNPRSAVYQIATLDEHIAHLPSGERGGHPDGRPTPRDAAFERAQARGPRRARRRRHALRYAHRSRSAAAPHRARRARAVRSHRRAVLQPFVADARRRRRQRPRLTRALRHSAQDDVQLRGDRVGLAPRAAPRAAPPSAADVLRERDRSSIPSPPSTPSAKTTSAIPSST